MSIESAMQRPSPEKPKGKRRKKSEIAPKTGEIELTEADIEIVKDEVKPQKAASEGVLERRARLLREAREKKPSEELQKIHDELRAYQMSKPAETPPEVSEGKRLFNEARAEAVAAEEAEWEAKIAEAKKKIAEEEKAVPEKAEMKPDERDVKTAIIRVPDERARKKAEEAEMTKLRRDLKEMKPPKPFEKMSAKERMKLTPEELLAMAEESRPEAEKPAPPTSERFTEQETEFFGEGEKMSKRFEKAERRPQEIMTALPLEVEMRLDQIQDMEIPDFDFQAYEGLVRRQQTIDRQLADDELGKIKLGWWQKTKLKWELGGIGRKLEKFDKQIETEEAARSKGGLTPMKIRQLTKGKSEGDGHMPMPGAPRDRM